MKKLMIALGTLIALTVPAGAMGAGGSGGAKVFISSAHENGDGTVTFPLYRGTSPRGTVWYIVLDANASAAAKKWGVNRANKLNNAGDAIMPVGRTGGVIDFPASVNFAPERRVVAGPTGFPPDTARPGAIGDAGYSPLIRLPDGTILNAPQLANSTGVADKVVAIDTTAGTVTFEETNGFARGKAVRYVSTDASDAAVAALEGATFAERLADAPSAGNDGSDSARASLAAFVNGQTGAVNPDRQGLSSAILDGLDPLNLLAWLPNQGRYSPLWDVHPAVWTDAAIAAGGNVLQRSFAAVEALAAKGLVTGPGGAPFGAADFVVNCPIVARV